MHASGEEGQSKDHLNVVKRQHGRFGRLRRDADPLDRYHHTKDQEKETTMPYASRLPPATMSPLDNSIIDTVRAAPGKKVMSAGMRI